MHTIHTELETLLKKDKRLVAEEKLMKNKVIEFALKLDKELLKLLQSNKSVKNHFFQDVDGTLVFDKVRFQDFVNLKEFLADSYTKYKHIIGLEADGDYLSKSKDVVLVWAYKDCLLEGGQTKAERENRSEIFWNETLAPEHYDRLRSPKAFANFKKYDSKGEHDLNGKIDFGKENLIIKGNNLLALYSLKERFEGKIKLIYIDPPYNTGSDEFGYNDSFSHSSWLTFMKNRIEIAENLLSEDGFIFINIDDNQEAYLTAVCNEIFKDGKKFDKISVKTSASQGGFGDVNPGLISNTENILIYSKDKFKWKYMEDKIYAPKEYDENYTWIIKDKNKKPENWEFENLNELIYRENKIKEPYNNQTWRKLKELWGDDWKEKRYLRKSEIAHEFRERVFRTYNPNKPSDYLEEALSKSKQTNNKVIIAKSEKSGEEKLCLNGEVIIYYSAIYREIDGETIPCQRLSTFWDDIAWEGISNEGGVKFRNGKKPEKLLRRIIEITTKENDIVLDFHLGSGTAAAVAHKMGRHYIGIEQLNYKDNDSIVRLKNVIKGDETGISKSVKWKGGGSFISCELAKDNALYIDKIEKAKKTEDLKNIWLEMQKEGFISHRIKETEVFSDDGEIKWKDLSLDEQKQILIRTLDLNHLYINYTEMDDERYKKTMDDETKKLNKQFYSKK